MKSLGPGDSDGGGLKRKKKTLFVFEGERKPGVFSELPGKEKSVIGVRTRY